MFLSWHPKPTTYHCENTPEKPRDPLDVVLKTEPSLVPSSLAAPFAAAGFEPAISECSPTMTFGGRSPNVRILELGMFIQTRSRSRLGSERFLEGDRQAKLEEYFKWGMTEVKSDRWRNALHRHLPHRCTTLETFWTPLQWNPRFRALFLDKFLKHSKVLLNRVEVSTVVGTLILLLRLGTSVGFFLNSAKKRCP